MGSDNHSLQLQEHWVFYYELVGDISNAINHQLRAVFYVRELLANGGAVGQVDYQYLVSSLEHLCRYYREMDDKVGAAGVAAEIVRIRKEYL